MSIDVDRVLDARPAWANRFRSALYRRINADVATQRRALATALVVWQLGEAVAPRRQVAPVRRLLLAMVVFDSVATYAWIRSGIAVEGNPLVAGVMGVLGDGLGLTVRTVWSAALVVALTWLAERRAAVRPALIPVLLGLGAITLVHAFALSWVWTALL
jgi:hypothetical protein